ncbi:MAG: hypothetical protein AAF573_04865 [Bacteroidota bacterium]
MTNRDNSLLLFFVIFFSFNFSLAQTDLSIGKWKSHLPYQIGKHVAQSNEEIIYAVDGGIYYIDKEFNSRRILDKVNGLSSIGIERISYNQANDILLVAYTSSVIDLVKPTEIITLSDIQRFNNISGDKRIYDIFMDSDSTALLATGYGISKINFKQDIFIFSTFTGIRFNAVTVYDDFIYATTEEGIYRAPNTTNINLQDFGVWEFLDASLGFPDIYDASAITVFNDKIYVGIDTALYSFDGAALDQVYVLEDNFSVDYLTAEGSHLVVGLECFVGDDECDGNILFFDTNENYTEIVEGCVDRPTHAIEDEDGDVWIADKWFRFRAYNIANQLCNPGSVSRASPFSKKNYDIAIKDGELWVTAGGITIRNYFQFWYEGFYNKINGDWNFYNRLNRSDLQGTLDFLNFAFHPEKDISYISTYYDGLIKYENDVFEILDNSNSTLGNSTVSDTSRTRTAGLAFDENNNLWIANPGYDRPISVISDDGEMKSFDISNNVTGLINVAIDDNGYKWFTLGEGSSGLLVFDEGDFEVNGDERERLLKSSETALSTDQVNAVVKDLDGDMWVGTGDGIIIFECGSSVFDPEQCKGTRKIVEQDGIPAFLLVGEDVRTIAVDGANRKWVGTTTGVFLLSSDGEELIARYTTENSPLFNNVITDIAIDPNSGEVYIGTAEGVISYRSDATEGGDFHDEANVLVFPNPIRPEYQGPIAIKGLARDSNVKITDINGQLVFETTALGGQAIWDGRDYSGRKAASGVYLVLGTTTENFENPTSVVAKIMFIN